VKATGLTPVPDSMATVVEGNATPLGPRLTVSFLTAIVVGVAPAPTAQVVLLSTIFDASAENVTLSMVSGDSVESWLRSLAALTVGMGAGPTVPNAFMISGPRPAFWVLVPRVTAVPLASMEITVPDMVVAESLARIWLLMIYSKAALAVKTEDPWITTSWLRVGLGSQDVLEATTMPEADRIRLIGVPDLVTAEPGARV